MNIITLTERQKELLREAIDEYVKTLRADDDPHNNALADEIEAIEL